MIYWFDSSKNKNKQQTMYLIICTFLNLTKWSYCSYSQSGVSLLVRLLFQRLSSKSSQPSFLHCIETEANEYEQRWCRIMASPNSFLYCAESNHIFYVHRYTCVIYLFAILTLFPLGSLHCLIKVISLCHLQSCSLSGGPAHTQQIHPNPVNAVITCYRHRCFQTGSLASAGKVWKNVPGAGYLHGTYNSCCHSGF